MLSICANEGSVAYDYQLSVYNRESGLDNVPNFIASLDQSVLNTRPPLANRQQQWIHCLTAKPQA